jgi:hypothetical protein
MNKLLQLRNNGPEGQALKNELYDFLVPVGARPKVPTRGDRGLAGMLPVERGPSQRSFSDRRHGKIRNLSAQSIQLTLTVSVDVQRQRICRHALVHGA